MAVTMAYSLSGSSEQGIEEPLEDICFDPVAVTLKAVFHLPN